MYCRTVATAVASKSSTRLIVATGTVTGTVSGDPAAIAQRPRVGAADAGHRLGAAGCGARIAGAVAWLGFSFAARLAELHICLAAAAASGGQVALDTAWVGDSAGQQSLELSNRDGGGQLLR